MKLVCTVKVKNPLGLHVRPASSIVKMLQSVKSSVFFSQKNQTVNAKSIMSLLVLAARKNSQIKITVEGEDAEETMKKLVDGFENLFWE